MQLFTIVLASVAALASTSAALPAEGLEMELAKRHGGGGPGPHGGHHPGHWTQFKNHTSCSKPTGHKPTGFPTGFPTEFPTTLLTELPTEIPSGFPTKLPSGFPTDFPTGFPTEAPSGYPSGVALPTGGHHHSKPPGGFPKFPGWFPKIF